MRVLLVNPSSAQDRRAGPYSKLMLPVAPLGLAYLASVARQGGHEVRVEDQYATNRISAQVAKLAEEFGADVVGFACLSPSMPMVEQTVRELRRRLPDVHVTLGNLHAAYFAEELLREWPVDSVVAGEGETPFVELLRRLEARESLDGAAGIAYRDGDRVSRGPDGELVQNLDTLPRPAWDLFRLDDYPCPPRFMMHGRFVPVGASRGCPWDCSYCSQNALAPGVRRRSMDAVLDEIEWMHDESGVSNFGFVDAIFPLSKKDGFEFARKVKERGLQDKIRWGTETRCDLVTKDLLIELKSAGCHFLMYGFESASKEILDNVDKRLDPQRAIDVMRWSKEIGIGSYGLYMIGFPNETSDQARETIRFSRRLDTDVASFARVTPYPGSPMYEQYKHLFDGEVKPWHWNNQYRPETGEALWRLPGMTHDEITGLLREAVVGYYLRPRIIWRHWRRGTISVREMAIGAFGLVRDSLGQVMSRWTSSEPRAVVGG